MSFKHKQMRARQARSVAIMAASLAASVEVMPGGNAEQPGQAQRPPVPAWPDLVKMSREEVDQLLSVMGIASTGNLMRDKSAINKARD